MPETNLINFFKQKRSTAEIKATILTEYFVKWAETLLAAEINHVMKPLLYIDLNAADGYKADQAVNAPVKILETIYKSKSTHPDLDKSVKTFFYDSAKPKVENLKASIEALSYVTELINLPVVFYDAANQELLADLLSQNHPALISLNPFSHLYAQQILLQSVKNYKADLFMLFEYNKMKAAVLSGKAGNLTDQLFGNKLTEINSFFKAEKSAKKQEKFLLEKFEGVFKDSGYYTFKFKINLPTKDQTRHYLIFASKTRSAYYSIKETMQPYSDYQEDGVALCGANLKYSSPTILGFFKLLNKYCLENLVAELAQSKKLYHYKTIKEIYEEHSIGTPYINQNYREAFKILKDQGIINLVDQQGKQVKQVSDAAYVFYKLHRITKS